MTRDPALGLALEPFAPSFAPDEPEWDRVLRDASARRRRVPFVLAPVALVVAVVVALLAWPDDRALPTDLVERALAATGSGPVFYAVFAERSPGELVDLRTGARRELRAARELWYEPGRGVAVALRIDGGPAPQRLRLSGTPRGTDQRLRTAFVTNYRDALASGAARVIERGSLDGRDVFWVEVAVEDVPATQDLSTYEFKQLADLVAIDAETYEPVFFRRTLDGDPLGGGVRILRAEAVPRYAVRLPAATLAEPAGYGESLHRDLSPGAARKRLDTPPAWLGEEFAGLRLARTVEIDFEEGTGRFETWSVTPGVSIAYGQALSSGQPDRRRPYVWIREASERVGAMPAYRPPSGSAVVAGAGAFVVFDGTYVQIEASSQELAIEAARALHELRG